MTDLQNVEGAGNVLVGTGRQGDFVLSGQGTAADKGFRNLSQYWYPKTKSYEEMREGLEAHYDRRLDIKSKLKGMKPSVNSEGNFVLVAQGGSTDGAEYTLTDSALNQYLAKLDMETTLATLLRDKYYPETKPGQEPKVKIKRDKVDAELFVKLVENGLRHYHGRKGGGGDEHLFRTYDDTKQIQAVLTKQYAPIDNRWYLDIVNELIPGGRYSHFSRADDNTLYGNVIIPDSIRQEDDSDYGGMLSLSNCEIGKRKLAQYPSVFRAICMNGCIWDQSKGTGFSKRHRGAIDMDALKLSIVANLQTQIPLAHDGIERLLNTRAADFTVKDVRMTQVFVAVQDTFKLQPKHLIRITSEFNAHESLNKNLFGVINAVTRAGQYFDNDTWTAFDAAAGGMMKWTPERFTRLLKQASEYTADEVSARFAADEKYLATYKNEKPIGV